MVSRAGMRDSLYNALGFIYDILLVYIYVLLELGKKK
jgi:hypothetical protein